MSNNDIRNMLLPFIRKAPVAQEADETGRKRKKKKKKHGDESSDEDQEPAPPISLDKLDPGQDDASGGLHPSAMRRPSAPPLVADEIDAPHIASLVEQFHGTWRRDRICVKASGFEQASPHPTPRIDEVYAFYASLDLR